VFLRFLAQFLQRFLKLLDVLGQLRDNLAHGIRFLTVFLSGAEIGLLLSVFLIPTTITIVVHGVRTPMLLALVAMLLEMDFLGSPGHRLGTRMLLPILALVISILG
jgi:hypothetical protein